MPSFQVFGGMVLALTLGANPSGSDILYFATVKVPEAEVRSGPSDKYYPTNKLYQGAEVEVVKELEGGWLAIKPPPDSLSWVNIRLVRRLNARVWVVDPPNRVPVLIGSQVVNEKPTVVGVHAGPGSTLISAWEPMTADDGTYLPVAPPPGERRYIRADAVRESRRPGETPQALTTATPAYPPTPAPVPASVAAAPPPPGGGFAQPRAIPPAAALPPAPTGALQPTDPLYSQFKAAEELERAGKTAEAERAYTELAGRLSANPATHDLGMQCYNRAYFLREAGRGGAAGPGAQQASGQASYPPTQQQANYAAPASGPVCTSDPGILRRASCSIDSRPTYLLATRSGYLTYVTAEPGVDLESYVDRAVQVRGPEVYRTDHRAYYISAQQVIPQP